MENNDSNLPCEESMPASEEEKAKFRRLSALVSVIQKRFEKVDTSNGKWSFKHVDKGVICYTFKVRGGLPHCVSVHPAAHFGIEPEDVLNSLTVSN